MDLQPTLPKPDPIDAVSVYFIQSSDCGGTEQVRKASNVISVFLGQSGSTISLSPVSASLAEYLGGSFPVEVTPTKLHVSHIVGRSAQVEVGRVTAERSVAVVQNPKPDRDFTLQAQPCVAMSGVVPIRPRGAAIATPVCRSCPLPALVRVSNVHPLPEPRLRIALPHGMIENGTRLVRSSFSPLILVVLGMLAKKEVSRITTRRKIAMVANEEALWDRPVSKKPGNARGDIQNLATTNLSVAIAISSRSPRPAFIRPSLIDFRPKRTNMLLGQHYLFHAYKLSKKPAHSFYSEARVEVVA